MMTAFTRKWRLKCAAVASAWKNPATSCSPSRAPETPMEVDPNLECGRTLCMNRFKRQNKTQTVLPSAETAAMLLWALLTSGQIARGRWLQSLNEKPSDQIIGLAA
jgi:putative transposase